MSAHRNTVLNTLALVASSFLAAHANAATTFVKTSEHVPGELIVKLKETAPSATLHAGVFSSLLQKLGQTSILSVNRLHTDKSLSVLRIGKNTDADLAAAATALKSDPRVQYVEPNYIVHALDDGIPNDPDFSKTWAMRNTGQNDPGGSIGISGADINVLPLWKEGFTGSKNIVVAVIDTGIDWTHPDLQANIYTNPGEIAGNGLDDDHNGFVDDVHGWNFLDDSPNSMDDHDHGTHCAGVIGAQGNNGVGIAGVNWNVSLLPVKFIAADGSGEMSKAVEAINYATMMKVNVMSNSWGGGYYSQALYDAIAKARDAGILFVTAAGNSAHNLDNDPEYPAAFDLDNLVTVGATDNRDHLGIFSNYGPHSVDVAAPGVRIYSTVRGGGYASLSGTSMATPHVAGVAALVLSANPGLSYSDLKERLVKTSTPVWNLEGSVRARGRVNAYNALHGLRQDPANAPGFHRQTAAH